MQHLNYCRQVQKAIVDRDCLYFCSKDNKEDMDAQIFYSESALKLATKFVLPLNGSLIDDEGLRGVRSHEDMRLPFQYVALEFEAEEDHGLEKRVLILGDPSGGYILVTPWFYEKTNKKWALFPSFFLPQKTSEAFDVGKEGLIKVRYSVSLSCCLQDKDENFRELTNNFLTDCLFAATSFLNAFACLNVHIEKSTAKSTKQGKKVKAALPFDDYHFLTVDVPGKSGSRGEGLGGSHRSPREHLRRGHIRRLDSGPIWVNACVVNAGIGSKVGKSYLVRKSA